MNWVQNTNTQLRLNGVYLREHRQVTHLVSFMRWDLRRGVFTRRTPYSISRNELDSSESSYYWKSQGCWNASELRECKTWDYLQCEET